jgi:hypothetical protein
MSYLLLVFLGLLVLAVIGLVALILGGVLGAFLGGTIGGVQGWRKAAEGDRELGAYRGVTWGSCAGALLGLALAVLLLFLAWGYYVAG